MPDILHRIIIEAPAEKIYQAITQADQLTAWWTKTETTATQGSLAKFIFSLDGTHIVNMKITKLVPNQTVCWQPIDGAWADKGELQFEIKPDDRGSALEFSHLGWEHTDELFRHCNSRWGIFLGVSLKNLLETGKGNPFPNDQRI